ncbi:MAG: YHYH protein [Ignavibacteria bacterium]|nr:YHYH protein [Ignavibacteria bacterium]
MTINRIITAAALSAFLAVMVIGFGCGTDTTSSGNTGGDLPAVYSKVYGATDVYVDGDYVVIKSSGRPEHKSPYYLGTQWESSLYEAYNGPNPNFVLNPNRISEFSMTYKIPLNPAENTSHPSTPMGPIGVAINGVALFNQYAGGGAPLTNEINSFEQYGGHPQQQGQYHYHIEPYYISGQRGDSTIMGFLLDGFPVYGPIENGEAVTNADLDVYHGHFGVKEDYPAGIYHYHFTSESPYLNGDGFYGTPGTVSY